ncbi:MAG: hypothetical protein K9L61_01955 [Candidatus Omnitrophica bacterium]|nr:hypothetical protein [Candidatus Omnitrophota bacterium]
MSIILNQIEKRIKEIINREKVELVEYKASSRRGKVTIRCLVDYPEGGITLDKCGSLNKIIFNELQEPLSDVDYTVEVHSPGLDRPLRERKDFLKVKGKEILLWLLEPVSDKTHFEAKVNEIGEKKLVLDYKGREIEIDFDKIKLGKQKFRT